MQKTETPAPQIFRKQDMISVSEFARRLGFSRRHAYSLVERGQSGGGILAFRYGRRGGLRIPVTEIERLSNACRVEEV
jgi:hypothetical protein